ncbi:TolC family protein [Thiomicrorhabdus sp. 6S2-11]|uniref:TolC family protein n=1 Tax=Thiomicrorhabdus marina TaxID=2818442 RepID=A0ABS3Q1C3_9GAMM|nr:TolC family protein [Thiomicrorhabdus marina]MBO1926098.1 TolC family protein [Thiomicrorhabdus marina]
MKVTPFFTLRGVQRHFALPVLASSLLLAMSPHVIAEEKKVAESTQTGPEIWTVTSQMPAQPLPNPLTLEYLLNEFPLRSYQAGLNQALWQVNQAQAQSYAVQNNVQLNLEGRLSRREFTEEAQSHNRLALHFGKVLYDGNLNQKQQLALQGMADAEKIRFEAQRELHKISVMRAFFDAILADFQFRIDNEAMAIEYIAFDKTKDRHSLGRVSDVDLLQAESNYQTALLNRSRSEQNLLKMRLFLANTLGYAEARPDKLQLPNLKIYAQRDAKQLKLNELQQSVEQHPQLVALKQQWQAQLHKVVAARNANRPVIRADAWVGQLSSYPELREGSWRADLSLQMPLYDSGLQDSQIEQEQAKLQHYQAQYDALSMELREQVTDLYFQLQLLKTEQKKHYLFGDYADLYLDYSRALYENETATDLGDSMVRLSEANYNMTEWQFKQALLWAQLDYLQGKPLALFVAAKTESEPQSDAEK